VLAVGSSPPGDPRQIETVGSASTTTTTLLADPAPGDQCDAECELATWQRAVWQAAVWHNATATTTTTAPPHTHSHASGGGSGSTECPAEIVAIIREAFAGTGAEEWAVGIAWRESRCNPRATNPNGCCVDSGLFQLRMPIHAHRVAGCDVLDAACNARGARSLYDEVGPCPRDKAGGYC
jgi:hypothetical protein